MNSDQWFVVYVLFKFFAAGAILGWVTRDYREFVKNKELL